MLTLYCCSYLQILAICLILHPQGGLGLKYCRHIICTKSHITLGRKTFKKHNGASLIEVRGEDAYSACQGLWLQEDSFWLFMKMESPLFHVLDRGEGMDRKCILVVQTGQWIFSFLFVVEKGEEMAPASEGKLFSEVQRECLMTTSSVKE